MTGEPVATGDSDPPTGETVPPTGDSVPIGEPVAPAVFGGTPPAVFEPSGITSEADFGEPASETWWSGFCIETGSAPRTDAAAVRVGLNTNGGFPETVANGFSTEAGMAFNFDAAAVNAGFTTEAASVAPAFRVGLEFWSPPGEETEAGGVSSGVAVSFAAPVICAVLGTTAPSASVV